MPLPHGQSVPICIKVSAFIFKILCSHVWYQMDERTDSRKHYASMTWRRHNKISIIKIQQITYKIHTWCAPVTSVLLSSSFVNSDRTTHQQLHKHTKLQQELSYRKQISHQLCTQYVEGIHRPKYYTLTLKSRLRVTQGHWKRNHWTIIHYLLLMEFFDVKYYRDLEMWVRGHWRSLKVLPFESLGTVSIRLP